MEPLLSANAMAVLQRRYLKKDSAGKAIETPAELFRRVAKTVSQAETSYGASVEKVKQIEEEFYQALSQLEFMPNSPCLMNAGRDLGQLSACFTLPIDDSMESIFETLKATALIHKSGGGTGFSFSRLRSKNSLVKATGGIASGPISFMKVYDAATEAVKQGGSRRGANMGILRIDHPDIEDFITCKDEDKSIANFNISVALTADFMKKLANQKDFELIDPHSGTIVKTLKAEYLFDLIVTQAHKNGEPGIIFIDRVNEGNPTPLLGTIESTNPCGEQPLLPYESCDLGSINVAKMCRKEKGKYSVDFKKLKKIVHTAVRFLDNVIEVNKFPLPQIEEATLKTRKVGLGIMGWATMLTRLSIAYNSPEALSLAEKVMSFITREAQKASENLAKERGTFPAYAGSVWEAKGIKVRNATMTTIAPTGTISIIAGPCSSGIEPLFALVYYKNVMDGQKLLEIDPVFEEVAKERDFYSRELMEKIAQEGTIRTILEIPEDVRNVFVTAHDISPEEHVKMQAAFQKYVHNATSKTINLPYAAEVIDVKNAFLLAYESGCKGITVYRDGSRGDQVLTIARKEKHALKSRETIISSPGTITPRPRPQTTVGTTSKVSTGCGNLYVTINKDEAGQLFELFTQMGKAGGCAASQLEAIGRLVSLAFRSGVDVNAIVSQLKNIRCPSPSWESGKRVFSCSDAIARVLEKQIIEPALAVEYVLASPKDSLKVHTFKHSKEMVGVCPDCGEVLLHEEGCMKCYNCGYSKC